MPRELSGDEIVFSYSRDVLSLPSSKGGIVGQERALRALRTGLSTNKSGYNVFVCGDFGTGRLTALEAEVQPLLSDESFIKDCLYVYNPLDSNSPRALVLSPGLGRRLQETFSTLCEANFEEKITALINDADFGEIKDYLSSLLSCGFREEMKKVNLVSDKSSRRQRPFIIEAHPSLENLFGYCLEKEENPQASIVPGSYMKAAGGFLVLFADEVLATHGLWEELKHHMDSTAMALKTQYVQGTLGKHSPLRPQVIALQTKVVMLSNDDLYESLCEKDGDFLRLFKSSPQFDYRMKANDENIAGTLNYLREEAKKEGNDISDEALLALLRYSSWYAESREDLSSQLSILGDILAEAAVHCGGTISAEDIERVIENRAFFLGQSEERINDEIASGDLLVEVDGMKVGTVNGLAVIDRGLSSFGTVALISATVAPGSEGIVNIEHEAGLSGEIHDKGLLILEGYLRKMYARSFPLSIYAGICFEQNYSEIDGDSASSSELYALLSAIGEIPLRQDIAVTGSVNQMGLLQPVGGINEKIAGFYHTCLRCGLTGRQGVIIPKQNIKSLILPHDVEEAIQKGLFHIYAITSIEEGMEIMSNMKAGERNSKGLFPARSFNRLIEDRLRFLFESGKSN